MKYFQLLIIPAILFFQCQNTTDSQTEIIENLPTTSIPINADTLSLDLSQSVITWVGSKPTGQHDGIISLTDGYVLWYESDLVGGIVTIDIPSLKIMNIKKSDESYQKLYSHLMSDDFFDSANYTAGKFEVTGILAYDSTFQLEHRKQFPSKYRPAPAESFIVSNPNAIIKGDLSLRGVTLPIAFPARIDINTSQITVEAKFNIDRTAWGLSYSDEANIIDKAKDKFIYNTVNTGFYLVATRQDSIALK